MTTLIKITQKVRDHIDDYLEDALDPKYLTSKEMLSILEMVEFDLKMRIAEFTETS